MSAKRALVVALGLMVIVGCSTSSTPTDSTGDTQSASDTVNPVAISGTQARMNFENVTDFYARPFPDESRRLPDGKIDLSNFPNPDKIELVGKIISLIAADNRGFATTAGIFFAFGAALSSSGFPTVVGSTEKGANVFLIGVEQGADDFGKRYPVRVGFEVDGGPFGASNLLSIVPLQGIPLRAEALYAAVVLRKITDHDGVSLGRPLSMSQLIAGVKPTGMTSAAFTSHQQALTGLRAADVDLERIAALAVFRTDDPRRGLKRAAAQIRDTKLKLDAPFKLHKTYDKFCVYRTTLHLPVFQAGNPPYLTEGGGWISEDGVLKEQGTEKANVFITIPRKTMPASGFPMVVLVRTGLGNESPLVDRGVVGIDGEETPGTGPAREFASVGYAGISIDGPHGGLRNVSGGDEQFLVFNVNNPWSLRDTIRQSALELILLANQLHTIRVTANDCDGLSTEQDKPVSFDMKNLVLFGHSNGAWISPLVLAFAPRYRAAILSGAGSSFIENLLHKKKPLNVRPIAEALLGFTARKRTLSLGDPIVTMLQWGGEPADAQVYGRVVNETPRQILMLQGVVDHYILPPIANATSLALQLDLAGDSLDASDPELSDLPTLASVLPLIDGKTVTLPVKGNRGSSETPITAVVVQHPPDAIQDGHEVVFQSEAPKYQYRCFLKTLLGGVATVPKTTDLTAACQ